MSLRQTGPLQVSSRRGTGGIDILVNNAVAWGLRPPAQAPVFERLSPVEWREGLRTNIEGAYATIQAVLPSMRARQFGRIVSLSSAAAADGLAGAGWYSAAKAALHGLTRTLARELGPAGILANVVMPGLTLTEGVLAHIAAPVRDQAAHATPLGRLTSPEDVAAVVVFLSSPVNTAVTGEVVRVGGGSAGQS